MKGLQKLKVSLTRLNCSCCYVTGRYDSKIVGQKCKCAYAVCDIVNDHRNGYVDNWDVLNFVVV